MADVTVQFPLLFESVELGTAGRVDFDQLLQNLGDKPHEAKRAVLVDGLNELTYGLLLEIGRKLGKSEQEAVATSNLEPELDFACEHQPRQICPSMLILG